MELSEADYEPVAAVVDPEKALDSDSPRLYDERGDNAVLHYQIWGGNVEKAWGEAVQWDVAKRLGRAGPR